MSLRRRLALTVAAAVAASLALAAMVAYAVTRSELRGQVDDRLREQAATIPEGAPGPRAPGDSREPPGPGGPRGPGGPPEFELPGTDDPDVGPPFAVRVVDGDGTVLIDQGDLPAPSGDLGDTGSGTALEDSEVDGEHVRVLYAALPDGGSITLARSLERADDALGTLRAVLFLVVLGGAGLAALGARVIAGRLLVPVGRLIDAAEHISETEDLSRRIQVEGDDELAQLGSRFNGMLGRLEGSRQELDAAHAEQRRLIVDASHELRTPVTSLRTNIEVIASGGLDPTEERRAFEAATAQAEELGALIGDLMDLARGESAEVELEDVRLDGIVMESVERARRHAPGVEFTLKAEESVVRGSPDRVARAVNNLLDNAAQHGGGRVEVEVAGDMVRVRDHGPGIAPDEAERLFDRFYRGRNARSRPGSGLGLAIVRQVAAAHGGSVSVAEADGGGAVFELQLGRVTRE